MPDSSRTAHAADVLRRADRIARIMDDALKLPGTSYRVGLDGISGLIPVAGDALSLATNAYVVYLARTAGVPTSLLVRMVANAGLDFAVGSIPLAGDLFDFAFKSHRRNVELLRRHLHQAHGTSAIPKRGRFGGRRSGLAGADR